MQASMQTGLGNIQHSVNNTGFMHEVTADPKYNVMWCWEGSIVLINL